MKAQADFLAGVPIEVNPARIEHELGLLWKPQDGGASEAATRACLSNLIAVACDRESYEEAVRELSELGKSYPSRIVLLVADSTRAGARGAAVEATVSALCHVATRGSPPVCCEFITLRAGADSLELLAGSVGALLVPDVTTGLLLTFGTEPTEQGVDLARRLRDVVDQQVYDTRRRELRCLGEVWKSAGGAVALRVEDLSWYETSPWRQFIADIFDDEVIQPLLDGVLRVGVTYAAAGRARGEGGCAAALLAGWISSSLGWTMAGQRGGSERIELLGRRRDGSGRGDVNLSIESRLDKAAAPGSVLGVRFEAAGGTCVDIVRTANPAALRAHGSTSQACFLPRLLALRPVTSSALLWRALERPTAARAAFHASLDVARTFAS